MTSAPRPPDNDNTLEAGFLSILANDVLASMERYEANETDQNRRDLVRTTFAALEGMAWLYREHVIEAAKFLDKLEPEEASALNETSHTVDKNGKVHSQTRFIPLLSMFRLVTRVALRLDPKVIVSFDDQGWQAVREANAIRNRITHPKRTSDLALTARNVASCIAAFYWMLEIATMVMEASNKAMADFNRLARNILEELKRGDPETVAIYNWIRDRID